MNTIAEVVDELPTTATNRIQKTLLTARERDRREHGLDRNEVFPPKKELLLFLSLGVVLRARNAADWKKRFYV